MIAKKPICTASLPNSTCSGVWFADVSGRQPYDFLAPSLSDVKSAAIWPTRVSMPHRTTSTFALPPFTVHDEKTIVSGVNFSGAPALAFLTFCVLDTSSDSPVKSISLTLRSEDVMMRASAGTTSPVVKTTMSPRTMSADGISTSSPSRTTVEIGDDSALRASSAPFAEFSVSAANMAFKKTMIVMAIESMYDRGLPGWLPATAEMTADATAAPISSAMMGCTSWMMKSTHSVMRGGFSSSFGPSCNSLSLANCVCRPRSLSESSSDASRGIGAECTSISASTSNCVNVSSVSVLCAASTTPALLSKRCRCRSFSTSGSSGFLPSITSDSASSTVALCGGASSSSVNSRSPFASATFTLPSSTISIVAFSSLADSFCSSASPPALSLPNRNDINEFFFVCLRVSLSCLGRSLSWCRPQQCEGESRGRHHRNHLEL
mmetsp:Transcript_27570/g.84571  ORF Transcript_27570/g.84571 Transcript_27570/m.84571 type:complete len:435 (-) Transcript_27570:9-1313(-)